MQNSEESIPTKENISNTIKIAIVFLGIIIVAAALIIALRYFGRKPANTLLGDYELVWIKGNTFQMESNESVFERDIQSVTVKSFYMGKYEVTNEDYRKFLSANSEIKVPETWSDNRFNRPSQPVVGVSWDDAKRYAEWIGGRLPTEAEWEYACRAGTKTAFHSGDFQKDLDRVGWFYDNSDNKTRRVGRKEPNSFGLYDMHGNAAEWVADDWLNKHSSETPKYETARKNRDRHRVVRGGSWNSSLLYCRSADRYSSPELYFHSYDRNTIGFRVAMRNKDSTTAPQTEIVPNQGTGYRRLGDYEFVWIKGNTFQMGSNRDRPERDIHSVTVKSFYLGKYEVTNENYKKFLSANPEIKAPENWSDNRFNSPDQPVVDVNWFDAKRYAEWIGGRLPTEAEWEYACRAGTKTAFYSGNSREDLDRVGWFNDNSYNKTRRVGKKEPNGFGLYDMHGNAAEWVEDDWHDSYTSEAPRDGTAWTGDRKYRILRGGSWNSKRDACRSAERQKTLGFFSSETGFRVALGTKKPSVSSTQTKNAVVHKVDRKSLAEPEVLKSVSAPEVTPARTEKESYRDAISIDVEEYKFIWIRGGTFHMGSNESVFERDVHSVEVKGFYIGRYEVTNGHYNQFLFANPEIEEPQSWKDDRFRDPDQPVVGVSWHDAKRYAQWSGGRLLTESEWEYACRANKKRDFEFGVSSSELDRAGWFIDNPLRTDVRKCNLHPVGRKKPNGFGLYDMHGNAAEWVEDDWHDKYDSKAPKDGTAWIFDPRIDRRVLRGGSWLYRSYVCRCASRNGFDSNLRAFDIGFRIVKDPKKKLSNN